jgi:hypothetical protein
MLTILGHKGNANPNHIKISTPFSQNDYLKNTNNNKYWQRKRNPYPLLVEMQISMKNIESSIDIPLKTKNRTTV